MTAVSAGKAGPDSEELAAVRVEISSGAAARNLGDPAFPEGPFRMLAKAGVLAMPVPEPVGGFGRRASIEEEWRVLRTVAKADGSVGRILDGHLNGVERLAVLAPSPCGPANSKGSPPASCSWGCGARTPSRAKASPRAWSRRTAPPSSRASRRSAPARPAWTGRWSSSAGLEESPVHRCWPTLASTRGSK